MATREWNCGTQCEIWGVPLVCLFHNPTLASVVPPLELGLGTRNPRFVAWPIELGLGTHNPRFVAWPIELGLGTHNPRFVARLFEVGLGVRNPRFVIWPPESGSGTRSPRFVVWLLELGIGTRNARSTVNNRSTVLALHCSVLLCVRIKMQGGFTGVYVKLPNHSVRYFLISHPTLPRFDIQLINPKNV